MSELRAIHMAFSAPNGYREKGTLTGTATGVDE